LLILERDIRKAYAATGVEGRADWSANEGGV
jgi:hypothetical protein